MDAYIKPEMVTTEMDLEQVIATSLVIEQEVDGVAEANNKRGSWGNLWND